MFYTISEYFYCQNPYLLIYCCSKLKQISLHRKVLKQDRPSLESSLYLNMTLRYLGQMTIEYICEEISMLFHSEKFYGGGWWHCNYRVKLQVPVS